VRTQRHPLFHEKKKRRSTQEKVPDRQTASKKTFDVDSHGKSILTKLQTTGESRVKGTGHAGEMKTGDKLSSWGKQTRVRNYEVGEYWVGRQAGGISEEIKDTKEEAISDKRIL